MDNFVYRNNSVVPMDQLLTSLRFYASAGHLASVADFMGIHLSTASRIIQRVSQVLANLSQEHIHMPAENDIATVQNEFYNMARFVRVIGCVDGTHIRINSPGGEDAEVFRNRKTYFSVNVQVVANSRLRICDIVARWPGSTHDMTIFANSRIKRRFDAGEFGNAILLGGSGYALSPYLMTPILNPNTHGEQLYNESHIRTRNVVERLFGVWKRRFPG
ncbi:DDE superfamily endonuclease [Popillia japonica]|uniref:DDE superfamily endonuclease n=1 Tax=Popillia japonica TaxID=7064 RepID=A0AAW1ITF6_POPJA